MARIGFRLYHSTAALSRAIQVQTWRTINHSAVEHLEHQYVSEALGEGIVLRPQAVADAKHSPDTVIHAFEFDVPDALYEKSWDFAKAHEGERYDWVSLVAFSGTLRSIFKRTDPTKRDGSGIWICSEWAEVHARMTGVAFVRDVTDPAQCAPGDLWDSIRCDMAVRRRLYASNRWMALA